MYEENLLECFYVRHSVYVSMSDSGQSTAPQKYLFAADVPFKLSTCDAEHTLTG